jgi:hypothetical protein
VVNTLKEELYDAFGAFTVSSKTKLPLVEEE